MDIGSAIASLDTFSGTFNEFKVWAVTPSSSEWDMTKRFSYLTLDSMMSKEDVDKVQEAVIDVSPRYDDYMRGAGVVIGDPKTLGLLKSFESRGLLPKAVADAIRTAAQLPTSRPCDAWGGEPTAEEWLQIQQALTRLQMLRKVRAEFAKIESQINTTASVPQNFEWELY